MWPVGMPRKYNNERRGSHSNTSCTSDFVMVPMTRVTPLHAILAVAVVEAIPRILLLFLLIDMGLDLFTTIWNQFGSEFIAPMENPPLQA